MKMLFSIMILVLFVAALLTACGGGGGGTTAATPTYTVGGTVSGLFGSGLVLQDNGGDNLNITANGIFTFATTVADGAGYNVTVKTQPTGPFQTCTASNNAGTIAGANVTNVSVVCSTNTYTVGGTVSGLSGSGLVLQDNSGDNLTLSINGTFTFATKVADGAGYNVTVKTQPTGPFQTCTVSSGTGTVSGVNVTAVTVACLNCAPNGVNPTRIVSASLGNDATADGSCSHPYKTITAALATISTGTVWVAPGTYDAANGEVFPISVHAGVSLIGDVANKGNGTTATLIKGHGAVGTTGWYAALVSGASSTISGCELDDSSFTVLSFGIYGDSGSMAVTANTFLSALYGGIVLFNGGNPSITNNTFQSSSYGVYTASTGTVTIQGNTFSGNSVPIDTSLGNTVIQGNTFTSSGLCGIQVESGGAPSIQNNTFSSPGYVSAALCVQFSGSPIVRNNTFNVGTGPAVETSNTATLDLGTALSAGNNIFSSIKGTVISHRSSAKIYAIGNTWPTTPPACGSQIVTSGTGTVVWGTGGSNHCP